MNHYMTIKVNRHQIICWVFCIFLSSLNEFLWCTWTKHPSFSISYSLKFKSANFTPYTSVIPFLWNFKHFYLIVEFLSTWRLNVLLRRLKLNIRKIRYWMIQIYLTFFWHDLLRINYLFSVSHKISIIFSWIWISSFIIFSSTVYFFNFFLYSIL